MAIDDVLFDAKATIEDYLKEDRYGDAMRTEARWLLARMDELREWLESPPGHEQPHPRFIERFGEKPL